MTSEGSLPRWGREPLFPHQLIPEITQEELTEDLLRMALAQKYQKLYAAMQNVPEEDYDADGAAYETLLEAHTYKIRDRLWEGVSMGHVTLDQ